ncbi:uncharacterized protein CANTADRAFT_41570, partial [Suhomyces tanzawaensis NRRL Y-17324]
NTITSLTFEQVNNDADELIELRGEGRYFGVTDPSSGTTVNSQQSLGPLCANCHMRGHIRAKCKTVVCHKCGVVGDHYETQCPTTMICSRCGEKGHMTASCTSKTRKRQYCRDCDTFSHGEENCPSIWRSYLTKPNDKDETESLVLPIIYCYNCASPEHYGDECPESRTSRVPNFGSAFSGSNLPKSVRPLYFLQVQRSSSGNKRDYYGNNPRNFSSNDKPTNTGRLPPRGPAAVSFKKYDTGKQPTRTGYIRNPSQGMNGNANRNNRNSYNDRNYSNNNGYTGFGSRNYSSQSNYSNQGNYSQSRSKPTRSGMIEMSKSKKQKLKS